MPDNATYSLTCTGISITYTTEAGDLNSLYNLYEFAHGLRDPNAEFATFIAIFLGPPISSESHFEQRLWAQLQLKHRIDAQVFAWEKDVSSDPENPWFSLASAGTPTTSSACITALLVSPGSSRIQHWYLAFIRNSLCSENAVSWSRSKDHCARDIALQGSINPALIKYASGSQARQYSGRAVEPDWRCPFRPIEHDA